MVPSQARVSSVLIATLIATALRGGQSRAPVTLADYGRFEALVPQARGGLSPDGRWLAYGINRSNRENELRVASDQRRIVQWFGYYLKGEPAQPWITNGVSFLDREQGLKRAKSGKGS